MASVKISKDIQQDAIVVTFSYDPKFVAMVKTIEGHKSSKTTEIYTHVSTKDLGKIKSPLDN